MHINERGAHTSVIEQARDLLKEIKKRGVVVSPGKIEVIQRARTKTAKFKKINDELLEMVVTVASSKQTFKVFSDHHESFLEALKNTKKLESWNILYKDMER